MLKPSFYRAFEDQFRGSRIDTKEKLRAYVPLIDALKSIDQKPCAVDLGCGRGEWLDLLIDHGVEALGVDLDEGMLLACTERNLPVIQADIFDYLSTLNARSLDLISAFHLVEHLSFDQLQRLISECHRVLKTEGLLILETPNPENFVVAGHYFYHDPTHEHPLPPLLLSFLVQFEGFQRQTIYRLNAPFHFKEDQAPGLWDVLAGASPDYAVIAQKVGDTEAARPFNGLFEHPLGATPDVIADQFQKGLERRWEGVDREIKAHKEESSRLLEDRAHLIDLHNQNQDAILEAQDQRLRSQEDDLLAQDQRLRSLEDNLLAQDQRLRSVDETLSVHDEQLTLEKAAQQALVAQVEESFEAIDVTRAKLDGAVNEWKAEVRQSRIEIAQKEERTDALEAELVRMGAEVQALRETTDHYRNEAFSELHRMTQQALEWHEQIHRIQGSLSWRVTAPLRALRRLVIFCARLIGSVLKAFLVAFAFLLLLPLLPLLLICLPLILKNPIIRNQLGQRIKQYPKLRRFTRGLLYKLKLISNNPESDETTFSPGQLAPQSVSSRADDLFLLPRTAREIYAELQEAILEEQKHLEGRGP